MRVELVVRLGGKNGGLDMGNCWAQVAIKGQSMSRRVESESRSFCRVKFCGMPSFDI